MKKLLFIFLLIGNVSTAQSNFDTDAFVKSFGKCVNKNIGLFNKSDIKLINDNKIPASETPFDDLLALLDVKVSEGFLDESPEKTKFLDELEKINAPTRDLKFDNDDETTVFLNDLTTKLGALKNGKVVQYWFGILVLGDAFNNAFLGGPEEE